VSFAILRCIARAGALDSAVTLTAWLAAAHAAVPDMPTVEGPITGPGEMQLGIRPGPGGTNLQDFGYIMEEYFVSGDWTADGTIPPRAPTVMEIDNDLSDGTRVALDEFGNAKGGVRTTYLDVPLFTYTIPNSGPGLCNQTGYQTRLPDEVLDKLYKNYGQYVSKVEHRLKEFMDEGWFPKEYASDYVQRDLQDYKQ
jgi:hypothetical protein